VRDTVFGVYSNDDVGNNWTCIPLTLMLKLASPILMTQVSGWMVDRQFGAVPGVYVLLQTCDMEVSSVCTMA
jgi:hypothetical protein